LVRTKAKREEVESWRKKKQAGKGANTTTVDEVVGTNDEPQSNTSSRRSGLSERSREQQRVKLAEWKEAKEQCAREEEKASRGKQRQQMKRREDAAQKRRQEEQQRIALYKLQKEQEKAQRMQVERALKQTEAAGSPTPKQLQALHERDIERAKAKREDLERREVDAKAIQARRLQKSRAKYVGLVVFALVWCLCVAQLLAYCPLAPPLLCLHFLASPASVLTPVYDLGPGFVVKSRVCSRGPRRREGRNTTKMS
jgi:hypothetical protein